LYKYIRRFSEAFTFKLFGSFPERASREIHAAAVLFIFFSARSTVRFLCSIAIVILRDVNGFVPNVENVFGFG